MRLAALCLLIACSGKGKDPKPGTTDSSPVPTPPDVLDVTCTDRPNELRAECTVISPVDEEVTLTWGPPDQPQQFNSISGSGTEHRFVVWGLRPAIVHEVVASSASGTGSTTVAGRALPASWNAQYTVEGTSSGDATVIPLMCAGGPTLVVVDDQGRPLAYQIFEGGSLNAFDVTPEGTLLALMNNSIAVETDLLGQLVWRSYADEPGGWQLPGHHEIHRGDSGITWILGARAYNEDNTNFVFDVVWGLDGAGETIVEWELFDHIARPLENGFENPYGYWFGRFGEALDYTHGNSLWEHDGQLLLSLRRLDAVLNISALPANSDFGQVLWRLSSPGSLEPSDFTFTSSNGATTQLDMDGQHTATMTSDGLLSIYDNRKDAGPHTRGMIIDLDASAGTADIIEDYPLDRTCQNQGSMFSRSDGSRVMACVDGRVVYEFERGGSEPVWTLWSGCGGPMFRAVPIDLPDNLDHLLQR